MSATPPFSYEIRRSFMRCHLYLDFRIACFSLCVALLRMSRHDATPDATLILPLLLLRAILRADDI